MDGRRQLIELLSQVRGDYPYSRLATVEEVAGTTCRVKLLESEEELEPVRLIALEDDGITDYWVVYPRVGSIVRVSPLYEGHVYFVSGFTEVERFEHINGDTSVTITAKAIALITGDKLSIGNGRVSLKQLLEDIVEAIQTLKLATNMGATNAPLPPSIEKCNALLEHINELFK